MYDSCVIWRKLYYEFVYSYWVMLGLLDNLLYVESILSVIIYSNNIFINRNLYFKLFMLGCVGVLLVFL